RRARAETCADRRASRRASHAEARPFQGADQRLHDAARGGAGGGAPGLDELVLARRGGPIAATDRRAEHEARETLPHLRAPGERRGELIAVGVVTVEVAPEGDVDGAVDVLSVVDVAIRPDAVVVLEREPEGIDDVVAAGADRVPDVDVVALARGHRRIGR